MLRSDHMQRTLLLVAALAACADSDSDRSKDVVGPFTGPTHRFVVDAIGLPKTTTEARSIGGDLDGNGTVDNQLGAVVANLHSNGNLTPHGKDMIAAGTVRMTVEITADELVDDPTVGVKIIGHDDGSVVEVGGRLVDGKFVSNRTATTAVPGKGTLVLPVFIDADPSVLPLEHVQLELTLVDGGLTGLVQGAADPRVVADAAYDGARQMLAARPGSHRFFMRLFENEPRDWQLDREEFASNGLLRSLIAPDTTLGDRELLGFGFDIHARACESGTCLDGVAFDRCFDRIHESSESDVDCGGACATACAGDERCSVPVDCQSRTCGADGRCAAPSCSDNLRDGFESDVDCGGACAGCALGLRCYFDSDCASGQCGPPCPDGEICPPSDETCEAAP